VWKGAWTAADREPRPHGVGPRWRRLPREPDRGGQRTPRGLLPRGSLFGGAAARRVEHGVDDVADQEPAHWTTVAVCRGRCDRAPVRPGVPGRDVGGVGPGDGLRAGRQRDPGSARRGRSTAGDSVQTMRDKNSGVAEALFRRRQGRVERPPRGGQHRAAASTRRRSCCSSSWIGLLRHESPKAMDPSVHGPDDLAAVAAVLDGRPRMALGWRTPAEAPDAALPAVRSGVATTARTCAGTRGPNGARIRATETRRRAAALGAACASPAWPLEGVWSP